MWLGIFKCCAHVPSKIIPSSSKQPSGTLRTLLSMMQNFVSPNPATSNWFPNSVARLSSTDLSGLSVPSPRPLRLNCAVLRAGSVWLWMIPAAGKQAQLPSKLLAQFQFQKNKGGSHIYLFIPSLDLLFQANAVLSKV